MILEQVWRTNEKKTRLAFFTLNCTVYTKGLLCEKGKEQTFITCLWCTEHSADLFRCALPNSLHKSCWSLLNKDYSNLKATALAGPVCPSHCCDKTSHQSDLRKGGFIFIHSFRIESITVVTTWQQGHEAAGPIVPRQEAGRWAQVLSSLPPFSQPRTSAHGSMLLTWTQSTNFCTDTSRDLSPR